MSSTSDELGGRVAQYIEASDGSETNSPAGAHGLKRVADGGEVGRERGGARRGVRVAVLARLHGVCQRIQRADGVRHEYVEV